MESLLFAPSANEPPPPPEPKPVTITADDLIRTIAGPDLSQPATELTGPPPPAADEREEIVITVLREMVDDPDSSYRPVAVLFQDFKVRCRMHRLTSPACDLPEFRRRLAMAKAGFFDRDDARRSEEHTSELQSLMRISDAVLRLEKKN